MSLWGQTISREQANTRKDVTNRFELILTMQPTEHLDKLCIYIYTHYMYIYIYNICTYIMYRSSSIVSSLAVLVSRFSVRMPMLFKGWTISCEVLFAAWLAWNGELFQTEDKSDILRQLKEWLVRIPPPLASKVPSAASVPNVHSILGNKLTHGAL